MSKGSVISAPVMTTLLDCGAENHSQRRVPSPAAGVMRAPAYLEGAVDKLMADRKKAKPASSAAE